MPAADSQPNKNKLDARQCLLAADKFIKELRFVEAKQQIEKARSLDPSNIYISAFIDRINFFEQQKKTEQQNKAKAAAPLVSPPSPTAPVQPKSPPVQAQPQTASHTPAKPIAPTPPVQERRPAQAPRQIEQEPTQAPKPAKMQRAPEQVESHTPEPQRELAYEPSLRQEAVPEREIRTPSVRDGGDERSITETKLDEMKKQIELLSKALEQEKKAREEMNRNQVQQAITQFRSSLEKAWQDSAPSETKMAELRQLALSLNIPDNVFKTVQREVKIEMYGRAVKEVISKRQLLRSSSSTLEWLRKVYQISMEEYLEYESKFLLDLVADQYKGTVVQISSDDATKADLAPKLKALGYAVVTSPTPEEALEKIDKLNPNVIICETSFGPGTISGIRFLHILRTNSKFNFIPFVFLSSEEDYTLLASSELRPNEGYVKKPVNFDELSTIINTKLLWFREYIMTLSK